MQAHHRRFLNTAILTYLSLRLVTSFFLASVAWLIPVWIQPNTPHDPQFLAQLENGSTFVRLFLAPWYRWDTVHYMEIAQFGYSDLQNTIWPPMYPLLIRLGMFLGLHPFISALAVSNLAAIGVFGLFYRMANQRWGKDVARNGLIGIVFFPTAFFLLAGYSESVFLFSSLACLFAIQDKRWLQAGLLAAFATLTRHQGILLVLPIAWEGIQTFRNSQSFNKVLPWIGSAVLPSLAMLSFGIYTHFVLRAAWPWETVSAGWNQHVGWPWEGIVGNIAAILQGATIGAGGLWINLGLTLLTMVLLAAGTRFLPAGQLIYAWALLLSVLVKVQNDGLLGAMARYVLLIFPLFFVLGRALSNRVLRMVWCVISLSIQVVLLMGFYWWAYVP